MGAKLLVLVLETRNKTAYLKKEYKEYPPEATSGVINRSFLFWLNPLFMMGYKGLLSLADLFNTDPSMASDMLRESMQAVWDQRSESGIGTIAKIKHDANGHS